MRGPTRFSWSVFAVLIGLAACARFVANTDSKFNEEFYQGNASKGEILFSHNINGETQPCGCRKFPLGGLEQAAGHFHQENEKGPVIYVDTGDLLFPSPIIPKNVESSLNFTADTLVAAMGQFHLTFFVPGDQDFAMGLAYLEQLSQKAPFTFLLANLRDGTQIKSRKWAKLRVGHKVVLFIGVLDPDLLRPEFASYFSSPEVAISEALADASPRKEDLVVLLSHSGMDRDKRYAQLNPRINWIVGGHSQGYTIRPEEEGDTKIVQVLSRNHFIGKIEFGLGKDDKEEKFSLLETREEMAQAVKPNPLTPLMQHWREQLKVVQAEEQKRAASEVAADPLPTFNSCVDCHKPQVAFWQKTSHALAWQTLEAKGMSQDPSCIGCHSLGWQEGQGYSSTAQRVRFENQPNEEKLKAYTEALSKVFKDVKSPRSLSATKRGELAQAQLRTMASHLVTHEYGNVQCVNCHDKDRDHPFSGARPKDSQDQMTSRCLKCHTTDQSPDWYTTNAKGLPVKPSSTVVAAKLKLVSCPHSK